MSDYNYDLKLCRNIMVDIRYVLFIVDKYAGAVHLLNEMTIVYPKTNRDEPKVKSAGKIKMLKPEKMQEINKKQKVENQ